MAVGIWGEDTVEAAIGRLKAEGGKFAAAYDVLMGDRTIAARNPTTWAKWNALKTEADRIHSVISYINGAVDSGVNWLESVFGMGGMSAVSALPLIPLAYVTGAVAALTYIVGEIYKFHDSLASVSALVSQGVPVEDAKAIVQGVTSQSGITGVLGKVENIAVIAVLGLAAYAYLSRKK